MVEAPTSVWNEVRFTDEGISISLFSESPQGGAVLEDEMWYTYDELQEMAPSNPIMLNLTDESREALSEIHKEAQFSFIDDRSQSEIRTGYETPDVGDVLYDDPNRTPKWSEDERVRVINVTETRADEYELDTDDWWKETVADYNQSEPDDAPVVVGNYIGSESEYAFPVTRLSETPQL